MIAVRKLSNVLLAGLLVILVSGVLANAESVTLRYAIWDAVQKPAVERQIALFEEKNPDIQVDLEVIPSSGDAYWNAIYTRIAGGNAPDVFWSNVANFAALAPKGAFLSLQPHIEKDLEARSWFEEYPEPLLDAYSYNGDHYGYPRDYDTIALFYNKDLFDEAGLEYPDESWDWATYRSSALKLTKKDPNRGRITQYGTVSEQADQTNWFNFIWANGGSLLNDERTRYTLNQPEGVEAIQFLVDLVLKDEVSPGVATLQQQGARDLFLAGRAAMVPDGSWVPRVYSNARFSWDLSPLPRGKEGRVSAIHGLSNVVYSGTPHKEQAWKFVKFLAGHEAEAVLGSTGTVIPARASASETYFAQDTVHNLRVFFEATGYSHAYPVTPTFAEWRKVIRTNLDYAWLGERTVEEALDRAETPVNELLQAGIE